MPEELKLELRSFYLDFKNGPDNIHTFAYKVSCANGISEQDVKNLLMIGKNLFS
jgi:hypothetical protein